MHYSVSCVNRFDPKDATVYKLVRKTNSKPTHPSQRNPREERERSLVNSVRFASPWERYTGPTGSLDCGGDPVGGTFFRGARTVGGRPCRMRPTVNCGVPSSGGLATGRRAWRRRQGGCGWLLWTRQRRVGVSAASLGGPRTSTTQWATARSSRTARSGRQLGRRKACGRAHFWPRGAEYASTRMVPRGGDAGRSVVDAQRGRLSSCWLCQLTALDLGGGLSTTRRGVGEWAGRSRGNEG